MSRFDSSLEQPDRVIYFHDGFLNLSAAERMANALLEGDPRAEQLDDIFQRIRQQLDGTLRANLRRKTLRVEEVRERALKEVNVSGRQRFMVGRLGRFR